MKEYFNSNKELKNIIRETSEIAGYLWQRGWAERNASNISVNITDLLKKEEISEYSLFPYFTLPLSYPKLAGSYFFVTGTGKRMRDLAWKPMKNLLILQLNGDASGYWIISQTIGDAENFLPTSELPTHLGIHQMIAERGSNEKVVMHTHAHELVTLTHAKEFCDQDRLNQVLWSMHPETVIFVPKGVGFVPYFLPGSVEIAAETLKALQNHDVALWEKHGVFAIGKSVEETFDAIDILAKSAHIFFMCRSANIIPDSFSEAQLAELRKLAENF
ncbi:MAG: rhamnulose-1-phosphate aldolase [Bacteroidales bacterium]|nr:rhamnulose-1-phosphate aldolase [Bacteroidales bacterium]